MELTPNKRKEDMSILDSKREVRKKSGVFFSGNLAGVLFNSFYLFVAARFLDPSLYGEFLYLSIFCSFVAIFTGFGLSTALLYFLSCESVDSRAKQKILVFAIVFVSVLSLIAIFFGFFFSDFVLQIFLNGSPHKLFYLQMLPYLLLTALQALLSEALRGRRLITAHTRSNFFLLPCSKLVFLALLLLCGVQNFYAPLLSLYLSTLLSLFYNVHILRKEKLLEWNKSSISYTSVLSYAWPMLLNNVLGVVMTNLDKYMIGTLLTMALVTVYNVALAIGNVSNMALSAVNSIFAPVVASLYSSGKLDELKILYRDATRWVVIFNVFIFGFVLLFAEDLMRIAGDSFIVGANALRLICLGQLFNSVVGSSGYINAMIGRLLCNFYAGLAALILNLILNFCFIPAYGMEGAALATAAALPVWNIINFIFMYQTLSMHPFDWHYIGIFWAVLVACFGGAFLGQILSESFYLVRLLICGGLYSLLFAFICYHRAFTEEEQAGLRHFLRQTFVKKGNK